MSFQYDLLLAQAEVILWAHHFCGEGVNVQALLSLFTWSPSRHQCPQLTTLRHVCVCMHANEMFKEMRGRGWDGGWNEVITWKWDERQHVTDHLKSTTYHIPMYYTDMSHTRVLKHTFPRSGYLVAGGKLQDVCGTSLARNWTPLVLHRGEQDSHIEL